MADSISGTIFASAMSRGGGVSPGTSALLGNASIQSTLRGGGVSVKARGRTGGEHADVAANIQATLVVLRKELGDKGRVYRKTLKALDRAGISALGRARELLPDEGALPSGFVRVNNDGWAKTRTGADGILRDRAFPRYEKRSALMGLKVKKIRGRAQMTSAGWVAGGITGVGLEQLDPAAVIFDIAGHKNPGGETPAGQRLIKGFDKASSFAAPLMRVLLPAVIETKPKVMRAINLALSNAQYQINLAGKG